MTSTPRTNGNTWKTTADTTNASTTCMDDLDASNDKPVTEFAPPPISAILSIIGFVIGSLYYFPTHSTVEPDLFVHRVFPDYINVKSLLLVRAFFALVCFVGFASAWTTETVIVKTPYRPKSKVPRLPFELSGWKKQYPFTAWSFNILGISFALSAHVGYCVHYDNSNNNIPDWFLRATLILWEVAAPVALLIGAVVKYVLWPANIKALGHGAGLLTPRALLQHNANVIMVVTEAALLGGLPVRLKHCSIAVLYGCSYVLFTYAIMMSWHGQGPAFLYFFMDTTLGKGHTIALYVLLLLLLLFYGVFAGLELVLSTMMSGSLLGHAGFAFLLCASVCRFRD